MKRCKYYDEDGDAWYRPCGYYLIKKAGITIRPDNPSK